MSIATPATIGGSIIGSSIHISKIRNANELDLDITYATGVPTMIMTMTLMPLVSKESLMDCMEVGDKISLSDNPLVRPLIISAKIGKPMNKMYRVMLKEPNRFLNFKVVILFTEDLFILLISKPMVLQYC